MNGYIILDWIFCFVILFYAIVLCVGLVNILMYLAYYHFLDVDIARGKFLDGSPLPIDTHGNILYSDLFLF